MPTTLTPDQARFIADFLGIEGGEPLAEDSAPDLSAMIAALRAPLPGDIDALGDDTAAAALKQALADADALAESGRLEEAMRAVERLAEGIATARGRDRAMDAASAIPEGQVAKLAKSFEVNIALLRTQRMRTIEGLGALNTKLRATTDIELHAIADRIDTLTRDIPAELETTLSVLKTALDAGDMAAAAAARGTARQQIGKAERFLKANQTELSLCETNPFGVTLGIVQPLAKTIKQVTASVDSL